MPILRDDEQIVFPDGFDSTSQKAIEDNPNLAKSYAILRAWVRQVRGGLLSGAFYIEQHINLAIYRYFLDTSDSDNETKRRIFMGDIIDALSFERRINIVITIAREMALDDAELKANLNSFKTIRNSVAHNPCWFVANVIDGEKICELKPFMTVGKQPVLLTDDLINGWNDLTGRLIGQTKALAHRGEWSRGELDQSLPTHT